MARFLTCLNGGVRTENDTCICLPCFTGPKCETNNNVIKFSLTYAIFEDSRQTSLNSEFNTPLILYTLIIAVMLLVALINNIACLQTFFSGDIRFSNCGVFQILYSITALITIGGMQLRMLTMLEFDYLTHAYSYRYVACNVIPVLVISMGDDCMWLSSLLAIEFVLLECFNWSLYRSRWFSVISSIISFLVSIASHLHEIIDRSPVSNSEQGNSYACVFNHPLTLDIIDKVLRATHVIIPCVIHFLTSLCMLVSITRRTLLVCARNDHFRVFSGECIKRKHFFVPPFFMILSNLPHLIIHLKDACEDARYVSLLRLHIAFNILVYLPPCLTFFIYIYPSRSYMRVFKKTYIGRWWKRLVYGKPLKKINERFGQWETIPREKLTLRVPYLPAVMQKDMLSRTVKL